MKTKAYCAFVLTSVLAWAIELSKPKITKIEPTKFSLVGLIILYSSSNIHVISFHDIAIVSLCYKAI